LNTPAFQGVHQLPRRVQAFAHQGGLLAHGNEGVLEEARLVLGQRGGRHGAGDVAAVVAAMSPMRC
jgi:hypothetical protein